ncbi:glycosyltransferase [Psychrobacter faecalis]|uniref:glycosyltransferase n=1 Tax=Psychrobacter faecalis TaxID=180588 RepID=UPI0028A6DAB9|nr:glycosyltransferase [Psychrobacter faecalis]
MKGSKLALVNTSNLHNGGGVQVAISFIYELSLMRDKDFSYIHIITSKEVDTGLKNLNTETKAFGHYEVLNTHGLQALRSPLNSIIKKYDLIFTVFGPNYLRVKAKKDIVGFAQSWIINFDNPISKKLASLNRLKLWLKFNLQWLFFLRSNHYVVELEHVKERLHVLKKIPNKKISVVHNTVSSLYLDKSLWKSISSTKNENELSLGIVTRDYPHKNLDILPLVAQQLELHHSLKVHFYTTLNEIEWSLRDDEFKKYVSTVGSLSPDECPSFYEQIDGVVFPSLLECFSATPLEAMVMSKPLFASDRGFVRDVCQDHAIYIDPLDAKDIAYKIANYFQSNKEDKIAIQQARLHALNFSSAKSRAEKYLHIINSHLIRS